MINTNQLCMECMKDNGGAEICPFCGYRDDALQGNPYLRPRSWLMDRYLVGKLRAADGEGATYIGWDNILQAPVLVREYLPEGLCIRSEDEETVLPTSDSGKEYAKGLEAFLTLSRTLGRLRDLSALFATYDIFETNGTAYAVSEYAESISLEEFLHRNHDRLTFEQTRTLLLPAVSTLSALHAADVIHGGISPETLFVGKDGKLRFYGFAARGLRTARGALKSQLFGGYAAIEQYGFDGKIGPHTDVYAFAAVLYRVLTGEAPVDAKTRVNDDLFAPATALADLVPAYAAQAISRGLALMPDDRTATADRLREEFSSAPVVTNERAALLDEEEEDYAAEDAPVDKKRSLRLVIIAMAITLAVLIAIFLAADAKWHFMGIFGDGEDDPGTASLLVISSQDVPSVNTDSQLTRKVENFVGQPLSVCEKNYSTYSFKVNYRRYSEEYDKGVIISQSPAPDTEVPLESSQVITVIISAGSDKVRIPSVAGLSYAAAIEKLWKAGLPYDCVTVGTESPALDGKVTKISPSAGTTVDAFNAKVILYVENPVESSPTVPVESEDNREVDSIPDTSSAPKNNG